MSECKHPPERLYAWMVNDALGKDMCVVCLDCQEVLSGAAKSTEELSAINAEEQAERSA